MPGDPYAAFSSPDPYAAFSSPDHGAAAPAQPQGRVATALGEIHDSWNRLTGDLKSATAPVPTSAPQRNGALPKGANLIDRTFHLLAGGDNGTGEVHDNTQGGQAAVAADRVSGDLLDLPASLGRAAIRFANPKIDSQAAGGYLAAGLAGAPLIRPAAVAARAIPLKLAQPSAAAVDTAGMINQFEQAGVTPMLAAKGGGAARLAKGVSENGIIGGQVKTRLASAVDQAKASLGQVADQYGTPSVRSAAGERVQQGVKDFNKRFSDRSTELYDKAFADIQTPEQLAVERAQTDHATRTTAADMDFAAANEAADARFAGNTAEAKRAAGLENARRGFGAVQPEAITRDAVERPQVAPQRAVIAIPQTLTALKDISTRINSPALSNILVDGRVKTILSAIQDDPASVRFGDLRELRTWVRNAQGDDELRRGIGAGGLQRLEGALTQDIYGSAQNLGGPRALQNLQRADAYYRAGSQRIKGALQGFVGKNNSAAGEQTYDLVARAAGDKGGADIARLTTLKKSLQPDEWGDVAASVLKRMGKGTAGSGDDFSIGSFSTNFRNLSPEGKALLFGDGENRAALENLAGVMDHLKDIERMSNHSNSGASAQNLSTVSGLASAGGAALMGHPVPAVLAGAALGGLRITGDMMTNPKFVRWTARKALTPPNPEAQAALDAQLRQLAQEDHRLLPLIGQLSLQGGNAHPSLTPVAGADQ